MTSRPTSRTRTSATRFLNPAVFSLLFIYMAIELLNRLARTGKFDNHTLGDFIGFRHQSVETLVRGHYEAGIYYPVPFLLLQDALNQLSLPWASALWFMMILCSAMGAIFLSLKLLGLEQEPFRGALALMATLSVIYFIQWDLRSVNLNLVVLFLVLMALSLRQSEKKIWAGTVLSLAIAAKLYPVLMLPYLLWRKEWSWLLATVLGLGVLFIMLPLSVLGLETSWNLSLSWVTHLFESRNLAEWPDYYKPLGRALKDSWEGALQPREIEGVLRLWQFLWLGLVAAVLARSRAWARSSDRLFADATALLFLPLLFSPTFQPHHAAVVLLTAMWLVRIAADKTDSPMRRVASVLILVGAVVLIKTIDTWPERAVAIAGVMTLHLTGLALLAPNKPVRAGVTSNST